MARVYEGETVLLSRGVRAVGAPDLPRCCARRPSASRTGRAMRGRRSSSRRCSGSRCTLILRSQRIHVFNPTDFASAPWNVTFNTTSSFITNTNWQYYGGETTMSYFARWPGWRCRTSSRPRSAWRCVAAVIRGFARRGTQQAGQLLGRPDPYAALHPRAAVVRRRADAGLAGRRADAVAARSRSRRSLGGDADTGARPGGVADRHQAARDQRWRLLQRELRDAVRERHRASRTSSRCCSSCSSRRR